MATGGVLEKKGGTSFAQNEWARAEKKYAQEIKHKASVFFHHVTTFLCEHISDLRYFGEILMREDELGGLSRKQYRCIEADFLKLMDEAFDGVWEIWMPSSRTELIFRRHCSRRQRNQESHQRGCEKKSLKS